MIERLKIGGIGIYLGMIFYWIIGVWYRGGLINNLVCLLMYDK